MWRCVLRRVIRRVGALSRAGLVWTVLAAMGCAGPAALRGARAPASSTEPLEGVTALPGAVMPGKVGAATPPAGATVPTAPATGPEAAAPDASQPAVEKPGIPGLPELGVDLAMLQAEYDIPIEVNDAVVACVRKFVAPGARASFARWLARSSRLLPRTRAILREQGLPEDLAYVAMVESGFSIHARSRARAVGAWQLISSTARRYGLRQDAWVDERRDPEKAAVAAARFLRDLHERFGDWRLTVAAYNAGPRRVLRAVKRGYGSFWEMARRPGVLPRETRVYVPTVLAAAIVARHPAAFGLLVGAVGREAWVDSAQVEIPRATSLTALARAAGVTVAALRELNPELRRGSTPPRAYALRIPQARASAFAARWPAISRQEARRIAARRRVSPGELRWTLRRGEGTVRRGAVDHVELEDAKQQHLPMAELENEAGVFVRARR